MDTCDDRAGDLTRVSSLAADMADAHDRADAFAALLTLCRGLRRALATGVVEIEVPAVLLDTAVPATHRAGAVRQHLVRLLDDLVRAGQVNDVEARVIAHRFALDGHLRRSREVQHDFAIGRETMRVRYRRAMEALADAVAKMPLALRPPVVYDDARKELLIAFVVGQSREYQSLERRRRAYVHHRIHYRVLGGPPPGPPGGGRVEDRRLQRQADTIAAAVEDSLDRPDPIGVFEPVSASELQSVFRWLEKPRRGTGDHELARLGVRAALHAQLGSRIPIDETTVEGYEVNGDLNRLSWVSEVFTGLPLAVQVETLNCARLVVRSRIDLVTSALLNFFLAETLSEHGYANAAESTMRLSVTPLEIVLQDDFDGCKFLLETFLLRRHYGRAALQFSRGPIALPEMRSQLLSTVGYSERLAAGLDFYDGLRVLLQIYNAETAAVLAGERPDESRELVRALASRLMIEPAPDEPAAQRMLDGITPALDDFESLCQDPRGPERPRIAEDLTARLSAGPRIDEMIAAAKVVSLWTDPD